MPIFSKVGEFLSSVSKRVSEVRPKASTSFSASSDSNRETNRATNNHENITQEYNAKSVQSVSESQIMLDVENKTVLDIGATAISKYANMTNIEKIAVLEKSVKEQGIYLKALKDSMKVLNRRNTLAIIELQLLVRDCEIRHNDLQDIINPVMKKLNDVLNFKKTYDI